MGTISGMGFAQAQVHTVHSTSAEIVPMLKLDIYWQLWTIFIGKSIKKLVGLNHRVWYDCVVRSTRAVRTEGYQGAQCPSSPLFAPILATSSFKGQLISKQNCWVIISPKKTNKWIYFSILTTRKYLKLEIKIQVSSISESSG